MRMFMKLSKNSKQKIMMTLGKSQKSKIQTVNNPLHQNKTFRQEVQDFEQQILFKKSQKSRNKIRKRKRRIRTSLSTIEECDDDTIIDVL